MLGVLLRSMSGTPGGGSSFLLQALATWDVFDSWLICCWSFLLARKKGKCVVPEEFQTGVCFCRSSITNHQKKKTAENWHSGRPPKLKLMRPKDRVGLCLVFWIFDVAGD